MCFNKYAYILVCPYKNILLIRPVDIPYAISNALHFRFYNRKSQKKKPKIKFKFNFKFKTMH